MAFALEICLLRVLRRCGTSLELSEVRTRVRRPANERMKFNHLNFKAMKKTIVMMAALMLTAGGMVYAQQPEKQDTPQKENPTAPEQKQEPTAPEEKPLACRTPFQAGGRGKGLDIQAQRHQMNRRLPAAVQHTGGMTRTACEAKQTTLQYGRKSCGGPL